MMATTAVVGLRAGERLLGSSSYYSDVTEKLSSSTDLGFISLPTKNLITAKKSSNYGHGFISDRHNKDIRYIRALKEHVDTASDTSIDQWFQGFEHMESKGSDQEFSVDALLLLQKSLLEKQWHLSTEETLTENNPMEKSSKKIYVSGSEKSARRRRIDAQRKSPTRRYSTNEVGVKKPVKFVISPELLQTRVRGYAKDDECKLAREKLALSNVRLVMSVAQKYASMGAEIGDLIQGGLIGLTQGYRFGYPKGKSPWDYVGAAMGVAKPVAVCPSLTGLPGDTIHSYMADDHPGNDPWHGVDHGALKVLHMFCKFSILPLSCHITMGLQEKHIEKDEVNNLMTTTLREREREIIRLYYGLDNEFLTWEDIVEFKVDRTSYSWSSGGCQENRLVGQVGLVALEKLKHARTVMLKCCGLRAR
ncbi:RNA polymerase sigma factor sigA-like protein [Tanacetum coccineum]